MQTQIRKTIIQRYFRRKLTPSDRLRYIIQYKLNEPIIRSALAIKRLAAKILNLLTRLNLAVKF